MKKQNCCFDFKFVAYINDEDHHLKVCLWMPYTTLLKQVEDALQQKQYGLTEMVF